MAKVIFVRATSYFKIWRSTADKKFYWALVARNGEKVLSAAKGQNLEKCTNSVMQAKFNSVAPKRFKKASSTDGQYYFSLVDKRGDKLGKSETYTRAASRDRGIKSARRAALDANLVFRKK